MGLFSKRKKGRKYESTEAHDDPDPDFNKRKDPYLIIGDAPPRPHFAGKGLESNTRYSISREDEDEKNWGDAHDDGDCCGNFPMHRCDIGSGLLFRLCIASNDRSLAGSTRYMLVLLHGPNPETAFQR